jgi:hypothetical protein
MRDISLPVYEELRLTIPAREALERAGNVCAPTRTAWIGGPQLYTVTLRQPPEGIVECLIGHRTEQHHGLRLTGEPEYPGEWPEGKGIAWHEHSAWLPCPKCGSALVWYEAGYVPGYRICTGHRHHHVQLSDDGRSAQATGRRGISL